ncbi:MAG TPA: aminoglycoside phosphotransferase family protein [Anaeromyxobacteraceae bacterium]|nr:aminoglycoside phosphotransferase family protein [Anaeromyxobacteraceae bacterium]
MATLPMEAVRAAVERVAPGARIVACDALSDAGAGIARKGGGYGRPVRVTVEPSAGPRATFVFRTATPNAFGHDRRSDRIADLALAYDTFSLVPDHVRALDFGFVAERGVVSAAGAGEPYVLTTYAEGELYAEDLRRIGREGSAGALDLARCEALARWLGALHAERLDDRVAWERAIRDLVGDGEGIFGVVDAYGTDVPGAPPERLEALERRCVGWRWRLRPRVERLRRTHGDFHPFNVVFSDGTRFTPLDASRGCAGDPADDVVAMAINYVFFALQTPAAWERGFAPLWRRFWAAYDEATGDRGVRETAPPFFAWRALVLGCPAFYPDLSGRARDALLGLAERALDAGALDSGSVEEPFR